MLKEAIEVLNPVLGGIYVDATIGTGGHSEEILKFIGSDGRLIGIDRDIEALKITSDRLKDKRVILKKGNFSDMENILSKEGISEVDGILFDLGVSILQIKRPERGFSFNSDMSLDMRMDQEQTFSAWDVVNRYSEKELERIFKELGEERFSKRIARVIVRYRTKKTIDTCSELSKIVDRYVKRGKIHPATKVFQALRIEVNRELDELKAGLDASLRILKKAGRLCVISYHSLEDRIVKHFISDCSKKGLMKRLFKKPLIPGSDEKRVNPSSRSARLRAAEKI
ncbi:MAG: 16S rRNA (cytosine(1402)-N(4))-methyltransferase RsmH [Nitrospirae bacterium]|nr:16S rRNA (cytosine(1402)-N(4))-methyltransferase RsmH [Nitrospirota bacterium]